MKLYVGISGWNYAGWKGSFYPKGVSAKKELEYASQKVSAIEINGTFYALQKPESFSRWKEETPRNFKFSIKANRYVTHVKRLQNCQENLANFLASGVLALEEKLGAILWQLPPNFKFDESRFEKFFEMLPKDTEEAVQLAKLHNEKVEGGTYLKTQKKRPLLHAFEVRNPSFNCKEFIRLLKKYKIAYAFASDGEHSLPIEDFTASFSYFRMHGQGKGFTKGYSPQKIKKLAKKIKTESPKKTKETFVFFDNDEKAFAPRDAERLIKELENL